MMRMIRMMSRMARAPTPIATNANGVDDSSDEEAPAFAGGAFAAMPGLAVAGVTDKTEMDKPALARMDA